jgi:hypothetical protein
MRPLLLPLALCSLIASQVDIGTKIGGSIAPDGRTEIACDLPTSLPPKTSAAATAPDSASSPASGTPRAGRTSRFSKTSRPGCDATPAADTRRRSTPRSSRSAPNAVCRRLRTCRSRGRDLDILNRACRTGRMPSVTYSFSPTGRYGGQRIAHIILLDPGPPPLPASQDPTEKGLSPLRICTLSSDRVEADCRYAKTDHDCSRARHNRLTGQILRLGPVVITWSEKARTTGIVRLAAPTRR